MAMRARFLLSTLIFALPPFLLAAQAHAVPPADEAAADVLFNQASEAAIAGRLDEARALAAASYRQLLRFATIIRAIVSSSRATWWAV